MPGRVGNDFLLHVQTGVTAAGVPIFTEVGGQRGLSTETSREMIDLSDKTSDHSNSGYGRQDTTASLEGIMMEGDAGYNALENAINKKLPILAEIRDKGVTYQQAQVLVSSLSKEYADNDAVSASMEMQLNSPWAASGAAAAVAAAAADGETFSGETTSDGETFSGETTSEESLEDYTVEELRKLASDRGLEGYSGLKKAQLVEALS